MQLGRVDFSAPATSSRPKERKRVDRLGLFSIIASRLALSDAALELSDENRTRVGAILGTGVGPMESMEDFAVGVIEEGAGGANPAVFPNTVYNAAGGQVAIKVGALGIGLDGHRRSRGRRGRRCATATTWPPPTTPTRSCASARTR